MGDHEVHVMREEAERAANVVRLAFHEVFDAREALAVSRTNATPAESIPADEIVAILTGLVDDIARRGRQVREVLARWKVPPLPPLDLSNPPELMFYDPDTGKAIPASQYYKDRGIPYDQKGASNE